MCTPPFRCDRISSQQQWLQSHHQHRTPSIDRHFSRRQVLLQIRCGIVNRLAFAVVSHTVLHASRVKMLLTRRFNVLWKPEHECVRNKFGKEEAQRKFNHTRDAQCVREPNSSVTTGRAERCFRWIATRGVDHRGTFSRSMADFLQRTKEYFRLEFDFGQFGIPIF